MDKLREKFNKLVDLYEDIKQEVRQRDKHLYERWKAGGFLVDDDILSMYPALSAVVETLEEDDAEDLDDPDMD